MKEVAKGVLSNGMVVEVIETEAILKKEVLIKIGGVVVELYEITNQKRDGGKVRGIAISPQIKKPNFIENQQSQQEPEAPKATLSDVA